MAVTLQRRQLLFTWSCLALVTVIQTLESRYDVV